MSSDASATQGSRPSAAAETPLAGVRVAVMRAHGRGNPLGDALRAAGAAVTELSLTRTESLDSEPLRAALLKLDKYDWVLLTSAHAVHAVSTAAGHRTQAIGGRKLAVVGTATAEVVAEYHWPVELIPTRQNVEGLVDAMAARGDIEGTQMLYPAAEGARDVLPAGLSALGAWVDVVPVYRSAPDAAGQAQLRTLAAAGALDLITVATPNDVDALLASVPPEHARRLPVACVGPVTARAARFAGFPVKVEAESPTAAHFVRSIIAAFARAR